MHFELTPDSLAIELIKSAGLDPSEPVAPSALARALGRSLHPNAPRGCRGATAPGVIYFNPREPRSLRHELGHLAWKLARLPEPADEKFVTAIGACLAVPRTAFLRALRWGASIERAAEIFRVQHTCIVLRIGETTSEPAAVWCGPGRLVARGEWSTPAEILERMVRQRHKTLAIRPLKDRPKRLLVRVAA